MAQDEEKSLTYSGDHHLNTLDIDSTGKISLAMLRNFSDNAGASINISGGKVSGSIFASGDNHALNIDIHDDGTFDGIYEDKSGGDLKIEMKGGIASLLSGQVPETGITYSGDHHIIKLKMDDDGKLSGSFESKNSDNVTYKISLDGGVVTGMVMCSGDSHSTTIQLASDGSWKASFSMQNDSSKITISAEGGNADVVAKAGVSVSF